MKSKKHRKNLTSVSPQKLQKIEEKPPMRIKFNLSSHNLSCFIGSRESRKKCRKRTSEGKSMNRKSQQKNQKESPKFQIEME